MTRELAGHRAVVTGASRGVGRAVAEALAAAGAEVVATASTVESLGAFGRRAADRGWPVHAMAADLSDPDRAADLGSRAAAALGRVDTLVNNAGVLGLRVPLAECPLDVWQRALAVNVTGLLALTQAVLPSLRDGGAIINVTSGAAGRPTWAAYAVSKLAVDGMTGMWRRELADRGIRCVAINPGPARTAMRAAAYPDEDPASVPHPSSLTAPFLAVAAGADPGPHVEAAQWSP